jgi:hypothetical protein
MARPILPGDFEFVRSLASTVSGYTVCPLYLLWMLSRFHGELCAVAVDANDNRIGYILAVLAGDSAHTVFVWQLAATFRGRRLKAPDHLASHLKRAAIARGARTIVFTSVPRSATERSVKAIAKRIFHVSPRKGSPLPELLAGAEYEYSLSLRAVKATKGAKRNH